MRGKAHIGLKGVDAGRMQAIAQRRHIGGDFDLDSAHRRAVKGSLVHRSWLRCAQCPAALGIDSTDIKIRALTIIANQEIPSLLQLTVQVHDSDPPAVAGGNDAVAGLENKSADGGHVGILQQLPATRAAKSPQLTWTQGTGIGLRVNRRSKQ